jgi:hypothetical protein
MIFTRPNFASELPKIGKDVLPTPTQSMSHEQNEALAISLKTVLSIGTHLLFNGVIGPVANRVLIDS